MLEAFRDDGLDTLDSSPEISVSRLGTDPHPSTASGARAFLLMSRRGPAPQLLLDFVIAAVTGRPEAS